jgi:protein-S-isoprenylcysteine O-methyltransferase Ste14
MTIRTPAGKASAGSASSPFSTPWLYRLRARTGFDLAAGVLGGTFFLVLAIFIGLNAVSQAAGLLASSVATRGYLDLLTSVCLFVYYLTLWWLMLSRPLPIARTDTVLPSLVAFIGTYLPCIWILFASDTASNSRHLVSAALVLTGAILMVVVIQYLGRCFSIVPQARKLVRSGPYAIVRNPLYLVEEIPQLGFLVLFFSPLALALFLAFGAVQVCRILYEEKLLRGTFAEYDEYARTTPRLIPYVW